MSEDLTPLAEAVHRLAHAQERDSADRRQWAAERRRDTPEFRAEIEASRRPLRKMPFASFVRGIPELAEAFQARVPGNFWSVSEGRVQVPCPCKAATVFPTLRPAPCPGAERANCPRWYVFDGEDVRVAFSPKGGAPVPQDDETEALTGL